MSSVDTTLDLNIGRDWVKSLALLLICVGVTVAAFYGVQMEDVSGTYDRRFHTASFVVLPAFGLFSVWVLFRLIVPVGALVKLGPDGIADRRVNGRTIPWAEITNVTSRSDFVTLTLSAAFAKEYRLSPSQVVLKAFHKKAGPRHVKIAAWCLNAKQSELFAWIGDYRTANRAVA